MVVFGFYAELIGLCIALITISLSSNKITLVSAIPMEFLNIELNLSYLYDDNNLHTYRTKYDSFLLHTFIVHAICHCLCTFFFISYAAIVAQPNSLLFLVIFGQSELHSPRYCVTIFERWNLWTC